jgi:hypothetical protein
VTAWPSVTSRSGGCSTRHPIAGSQPAIRSVSLDNRKDALTRHPDDVKPVIKLADL